MAWIINTIFFISACFLTTVYSTTQLPDVTTTFKPDHSSILTSTDSEHLSSTLISSSTSETQSNSGTYISTSFQTENSKHEDSNMFLTSETSSEIFTTQVSKSVESKQNNSSPEHKNNSSKNVTENLSKDYIHSDNASNVAPTSASEDKIASENSLEQKLSVDEKEKLYTEPKESLLTSTVTAASEENVKKLALDEKHSRSHVIQSNETSEAIDTNKESLEKSNLDESKNSTEQTVNSEMSIYSASTEAEVGAILSTTMSPESTTRKKTTEVVSLQPDSHQKDESISSDNIVSSAAKGDQSESTGESQNSFESPVTKAALEEDSASISKIDEDTTRTKIVTTNEDLPATTSISSFIVDAFTTEISVINSDTEESATGRSGKKRRAIPSKPTSISRTRALNSNQSTTDLIPDDELK